MLFGLFILLLCQLIGEAIAHGLHVPVPGPVIGILLLVAAIAIRHRWTGRDHTEADTAVGATADTLLKTLGLLFVPAGAGIIQSIGLVARNGVALGLALVVSTVLTLIATVVTFRVVSRYLTRAEGGEA